VELRSHEFPAIGMTWLGPFAVPDLATASDEDLDRLADQIASAMVLRLRDDGDAKDAE
jgi:hypothetical protein